MANDLNVNADGLRVAAVASDDVVAGLTGVAAAAVHTAQQRRGGRAECGTDFGA
ncbi:hypothetical protein [Mycobacterium sp. 141]|uniref:hypothetical protein n=1 Tax=Mycobacterium sp. 141 TaxID=1120797 RepID=UPI00037D58D1|nr:hypothetical protein [Mycobacterium sp. 141]